MTRPGLTQRLPAAVQDQGGEDRLRELVAGLKGSEFLAADPELDPPDLPPVADFLSQEGLTALAA